MKTQSKNVGHRLTEALTKEQLESLLDSVGSKTLLEKIKKRSGGREKDMADTVKKVLAAGSTAAKKNGRFGVRMASGRKLIEAWDGLWNRWDEIVSEVGDDEGRYAVQEHHWESPCFDGSALAADLEKVAMEMETMIDRVHGIVKNDGLFSDAVGEINQAIGSYPEWMGEEDECCLEYYTSRCVLQWMWLSGMHETKPGAVLLDKIESVFSDNELVELDCSAVVDVIAGMPDPVRREIYAELSNGRYLEEQDNVYSPWNILMLDFRRRYDKGAYLEQCSRDLERNWKLGRPHGA